ADGGAAVQVQVGRDRLLERPEEAKGDGRVGLAAEAVGGQVEGEQAVLVRRQVALAVAVEVAREARAAELAVDGEVTAVQVVVAVGVQEELLAVEQADLVARVGWVPVARERVAV